MQTKKSKKEDSFLVETAKTVGLSVLLAFGIRTFVAGAYFIPSGSMEPTLQIDDRLLVDKVSYRFSDPQRGDIVVFDPTEQLQKEGQKEAFVKRVIGLPGDVVVVRKDQATINGQPLNENYLSKLHPDQMTAIYAKKVAENLKKNPADQNPAIKSWDRNGAGIDAQLKVPAGQYLVLGDHRDDSRDSRYWGFVPKNKIVGKAMVKFWPVNRAGAIEPQPAYRK